MTTYTLEGGNVDYANDWQLPNGTNSTVVPGAGDTVIFPDGSGPFGSLNVSEVEIQGDVTLSALTLTSGSSTISDNPLGGGNGGTFNMISGSSWTVNGTLTDVYEGGTLTITYPTILVGGAAVAEGIDVGGLHEVVAGGGDDHGVQDLPLAQAQVALQHRDHERHDAVIGENPAP